MIWQNELCAICTCALLAVIVACLTVWFCVRHSAEAKVRIARIENGLSEWGEEEVDEYQEEEAVGA
ncbi:MAG: hypothetical protein IJ087_09930 [Eggerthellaceae bacterium]|nr:hypothetical protein [Eggerthellaceae bacterium]